MKRFIAYRRALSERGTHSEAQRNPDSEVQFEGVIWTDGSCTLRWRTAINSTSVFKSFEEMIQIHGHPEYGTEIHFRDGDPPECWFAALRKYGEQVAALDAFGEFKEVEGRLGPVAMYVQYSDGRPALGIFPSNEKAPR